MVDVEQAEQFGDACGFAAEHGYGEAAAEEEPGDGSDEPDHEGGGDFEEGVADEVGGVYFGGGVLVAVVGEDLGELFVGQAAVLFGCVQLDEVVRFF